jgi:hypothetical protein
MGEQRCLSHVYTQNPSLSQWGLLNVGFIGLDGCGFLPWRLQLFSPRRCGYLILAAPDLPALALP